MATIKINGMNCEHCKKAVEDALIALGLRDVAVNLAEGTASYADDPVISLEKVREAVDETGYEAVI